VLTVLTVQGWTGDTVNLFAVFPSDPAPSSFGGFSQALIEAGPILVWHAFEGGLLLILSLLVLALSLRKKPRSVLVCSLLGLLMIVSATIGGILFVLSGFQANPSSAQMGGSFIGAYAFYFLELYYAK